MNIDKREVNVTVRGESEAPMRMKIKSDKFEMIIDEPENIGGTNMGTSPIQVLVMSLAGCINITGHQVAQQRSMQLNGMKTMDKPTFQNFHIEGVKHIIPSNAMEALKNHQAVLIDVREENEVKLEMVPLDNVIYHPTSLIMQRLQFISKEQNIILGCPGGTRSRKVANLLNQQGYPHVFNLDGGFSNWKKQGFPFISNISFTTISGCSCGSCTSESINEDSKCC